MTDLQLVIFDVDGTLIDSQADILGAMDAAFAAIDRPAPPRATVLSVVGLSLPFAIAQLAPDEPPARVEAMTVAYRTRFQTLRKAGGAESMPFYPGMRALVDRLAAADDLLLGIATGKSRRGLDALIAAHGLEGTFVTSQTADDHPSKPNPAMLEAALAETGIDRTHAVMIGDTTYDIEMAHAAGIRAIAVGWGYHPPKALAAADAYAANTDALAATLDAMMERTA
jgi:phosphoglycolate phosphatase